MKKKSQFCQEILLFLSDILFTFVLVLSSLLNSFATRLSFKDCFCRKRNKPSCRKCTLFDRKVFSYSFSCVSLFYCDSSDVKRFWKQFPLLFGCSSRLFFVYRRRTTPRLNCIRLFFFRDYTTTRLDRKDTKLQGKSTHEEHLKAVQRIARRREEQ